MTLSMNQHLEMLRLVVDLMQTRAVQCRWKCIKPQTLWLLLCSYAECCSIWVVLI